ncbi:hydroxypyruvate isomerase family protein [Bacillus sp. Marseille-P3661]|uniref:hydroxypyruvate isomerase family protein n=1 Tax=Bacillus sp. Marseille-P3661 TaxID=1936234 RepID=UPI000C826DB9|nr:TIM barrel protein [Bacillus sp. Marseille-P3661]
MSISFSICIPMMFQNKSIQEGLFETNKLGLKNVEIMRWYDEDIFELKKLKETLKLNIVLLSTKPQNLTDPSTHTEFLQGLNRTIETAKLLDCTNIVCISGDEQTGMTRSTQMRNLVDVLSEAAKMVERAGITLNLEPINTKIDHPNQFLSSSDEAFEIVKSINSPNLKVLFDIYHQQITEGDLIRRISENMEWIGHFHAAGNPGRHEITEGEINYKSILKYLEESGYNGYVGLEYIPLRDPGVGIHQIIEEMNIQMVEVR